MSQGQDQQLCVQLFTSARIVTQCTTGTQHYRIVYSMALWLGRSERKVRKTKFVNPSTDLVLLSGRVLDNLLVSEQLHDQLHGDYMEHVQECLAPHHRKIVTDWMLEVCQEEECPPQVFLSSVQYLDRVLSQLSIKTKQFQLLASACLLLSSKLHDPRPFSLHDLVIYTDCPISVQDLQVMEMTVLKHLRWELATPTSAEFLELIFANMGMKNFLSKSQIIIIHKHSASLLALAATEYKYYNIRPSVLVSLVTYLF